MTPEEFVEALQSRGVAVSVRANRLRLDPGETWRSLTVSERACLNEHRAAIKLLVNAPVPPPPTRTVSEPTLEPATPEPPPKPRVYSVDCERFVTEQDLRDAGVVGTDRAAYERAREWLREKEQEDTITAVEDITRPPVSRNHCGVPTNSWRSIRRHCRDAWTVNGVLQQTALTTALTSGEVVSRRPGQSAQVRCTWRPVGGNP